MGLKSTRLDELLKGERTDEKDAGLRIEKLEKRGHDSKED
jgi:hypothetical protein